MNVSKVASAVFNDIHSGLSGYESTLSISIPLLEDEVVNERLTVIRELLLKNQLPAADLEYSLNCILVDYCKSLDKCCLSEDYSTPVAHFEIPLFVDNSISFVGSTDRKNKFKVYTSPSAAKNHQYRRVGKLKPYVFIDTTPNASGRIDCFLFGPGTDLLERVTVTAIWKDERQLEEFSCCASQDIENLNAITNEVLRRLTEKKFRWYRLAYMPLTPNDLTPL